MATGGMFWLSRINEHSHYANGLLGPMMLTAAGIGLIFVPLSLVALAKVADDDAASPRSLLNTGQQVGARSGSRSWARWPGARWRTACTPRPPR